jgi:hypothetical protein
MTASDDKKGLSGPVTLHRGAFGVESLNKLRSNHFNHSGDTEIIIYISNVNTYVHKNLNKLYLRTNI